MLDHNSGTMRPIYQKWSARKKPRRCQKMSRKKAKRWKMLQKWAKKGKRSLGPIVHEGLISLETDPSITKEKLFKGNWSNGDAVKETKEPASGTSFMRPLQIAPCAPPSIFSIKNSKIKWEEESRTHANPSQECQQIQLKVNAGCSLGKGSIEKKRFLLGIARIT